MSQPHLVCIHTSDGPQGVRNRFAAIFLDCFGGPRENVRMARPRRTQAGGVVYHVLNRANRRAQIFAKTGDDAAFVRTLADAQAEHPMRLLAYAFMPNHWHLVLWPEQNGRLF